MGLLLHFDDKARAGNCFLFATALWETAKDPQTALVDNKRTVFMSGFLLSACDGCDAYYYEFSLTWRATVKAGSHTRQPGRIHEGSLQGKLTGQCSLKTCMTYVDWTDKREISWANSTKDSVIVQHLFQMYYSPMLSRRYINSVLQGSWIAQIPVWNVTDPFWKHSKKDCVQPIGISTDQLVPLDVNVALAMGECAKALENG